MTDRMEAHSPDTDTLARLYALHGDRVYGYCVRMLGCEHDAADALQDTFTNLARRGIDSALRRRAPALLRVRAPPATRASTCSAAGAPRPRSTRCARRARTSSRSRRRALPEQSALDGATRDAVYSALATVPERQRTAWVLRELGDLSYDEVGDRLGMNANAVAQLLHRARRALRVAAPTAALQA